MSVSVINNQGDHVKLTPATVSSLASLALEAEKPNANWDEINVKMLHLLEADGFEIMKLQPEISYYDSKEGRVITDIRISYTGK